MSRTESQRTASTAYLLRPRAKGSPMRDTLSRSLQPTSIHEHPLTSRLPSMALARFWPMRRPPAHFACACTRWNRRNSAPTPCHRCRRPGPQVMTRLGVAFTCCETLRPPPWEGRPAFCGGLRPVRACSAASEPVGRIADALCRAPDTTHRSGPALETPRTHPLVVRQHRAVVSPEHLPSTGPSPVRRASPSRNRRPPLLPRLGRRGTASDMGWRARGAR